MSIHAAPATVNFVVAPNLVFLPDTSKQYMTIAELKLLRESEDKVEFKAAERNYPYNGGSHNDPNERKKCYLGYIVALANERGGRLVLGMADRFPHNVVGTSFAAGDVGKLEDAVYQALGIRVRLEELYENGKRVLVTNVPSRPVGRLMKYEGVALMRTGESLRVMSDDEMFAILSEQEPDFSAKICTGLSVSDLDENALQVMKDAYARKQSNPGFKNLSTEQILSDLNLLVGGRLNYAALLLLGRKDVIDRLLSQAKIIWEFRYNDSSIPADFRVVESGPIFMMIDAVWELLNRQNKNVHVESGAYIFSVPAFNETVIREAVLNAIAHRDYTIGSDIVIKQSPKRISIQNPGGFPKGVSIENLLTVNSTPRSRVMAEVLEKTGLVERSGQGIDKIFSYTLLEGKPEPDYTDSNPFQVTLHLDSVIIDKAFHIFMNETQAARTEEHKLNVEQIIALHKVRQGLYNQINPGVIKYLELQGLVVRAGGNSLRYTLNSSYQRLASKELRIGTRYVVAELEGFLFALQGKTLKIGDLEPVLADSLNRNQIKYLINKLVEDGAIISEGTGRGTKYKLSTAFSSFHGGDLFDKVVAHLRQNEEIGKS